MGHYEKSTSIWAEILSGSYMK